MFKDIKKNKITGTERDFSLNFDKENSPYDYYGRFTNRGDGVYCRCTNQTLVTHGDYCELCNGKIMNKVI